jgi:hypothetical protein
MTNPVVFSTTRMLGTQFEKCENPAARVYRTRKSFPAVHFELGAKGQIVFLPGGAELSVVGPSSLAGCFEVLCQERLYNMFRVDLLGIWSTPVKSTRNKSVRAFTAVEVCV